MDYLGSFILMRHGARNPIKHDSVFFNILYKNWDQHDSNLTEIGKLESFVIGYNFGKCLDELNVMPLLISQNSGKSRTIDTEILFKNGFNSYFSHKNYSFQSIKLSDPNLYFRNYSTITSKNKIKKDKLKNSLVKNYKKYDKLEIIPYINFKLKKYNFLVNENNIDSILIDIAIAYYHNHFSEKNKFPFLFNKDLITLALDVEYNFRCNFYSIKLNRHIGIGKLPDLLVTFLQCILNKNTFWINFVHDTTIHYLLSFFYIKYFPFCQFNGYINIEVYQDCLGNKHVCLTYNYQPFDGIIPNMVEKYVKYIDIYNGVLSDDVVLIPYDEFIKIIKKNYEIFN